MVRGHAQGRAVGLGTLLPLPSPLPSRLRLPAWLPGGIKWWVQAEPPHWEGGMGTEQGVVSCLWMEPAIIFGPAPAGRLRLEGSSVNHGRLGSWSLSAERSQQAKGELHSWDLPEHLQKVPCCCQSCFLCHWKYTRVRGWGVAVSTTSPRMSHGVRPWHMGWSPRCVLGPAGQCITHWHRCG